MVKRPPVQKTFWLLSHKPGYSLMTCLGQQSEIKYFISRAIGYILII